jgi:hypothetical protein
MCNDFAAEIDAAENGEFRPTTALFTNNPLLLHVFLKRNSKKHLGAVVGVTNIVSNKLTRAAVCYTKGAVPETN